MEGELLQDLFKTLPPSELVDIAAECGRVLAALSEHPFDRCGEFGPGLNIVHDSGCPPGLDLEGGGRRRGLTALV